MRFNAFRFLGAKLVQYHLSITIQMVSTEGFNSDKPGTDIRFTGFFKSQTIYRAFTHSRPHSLFLFSKAAEPWHENRRALETYDFRINSNFFDWLFENKEILSGSQNVRADCWLKQL